MSNGKVREWIGPRIVPIFADNVTWDIDSTYEPLMMVQYSGETYMSRQYVPSGISLPDIEQEEIANDYWVHMSNWNAQIEGYRQELQQYIAEVQAYDNRITTNTNDITSINNKLGSGFDSINTVTKAIADIIAEIGSGFDSTNTVSAAIANVLNDISDINGVIGNGFSTENTIESNIESIKTYISGKSFTQPAWRIIDRYLISETPNSDATTGAQAGCFFTQENVNYNAVFINKNNTLAGHCDTIRIRNSDTHALVVDFTITPCHGLAIDYNPTTKQILYYDETASLIYLVNVASIVSPNVEDSFSTDNIPIWWGLCWYSEDKFLFYREAGTTRVCDIRKADDDLTYVKSITLTDESHIPFTSVYQDVSYSNGIIAVEVSSPEAILLYSDESGELLNIINLPTHVGCSVIVELEGITITDECIYVCHPMSVDSVMTVTWLRWNFKYGELSSDESLHPWNNTETIAAYVDWDSGDLIDPVHNSRKFKLAGDLENFAKFNYPGSAIVINFNDDYPLYFRSENVSITINLSNKSFPLGMRISNSPHVIVNSTVGCTVADEIVIDHSFATINNPGNIVASGTNNIWEIGNSVVCSNGTFDKGSFNYTRVLAPNKPTNSTAWKCFYNTPVDNWN